MAQNIYRRDSLSNLIEIPPYQKEIVTIEDNTKHAFLFYGQLRTIGQLLDKGEGLEVRGWDTNFGKGGAGRNSFDASSSKIKFGTGAVGDFSFAANLDTLSKGKASSSFGIGNSSLGVSSHTENGGLNPLNLTKLLTDTDTENKAGGDASHAEGIGTRTGNFSGTTGEGDEFTEDDSGIASHAEGENSNSVGTASHAQNVSTKSIGDGSTASGLGTIARAKFSLAEGVQTIADNDYSYGFIESSDYVGKTLVLSPGSIKNIAADDNIFYFIDEELVFNHVVSKNGDEIVLQEYLDSGTSRKKLYKIDDFSHLIHTSTPLCIFVTNSGDTEAIASHVEGILNVATGNGSHAEGIRTISTKEGSHSEGKETRAEARYSHVEGFRGKTYGAGSHVEGYAGRSYGSFDHVEGFRNVILDKSSFIDTVSVVDNVLEFSSDYNNWYDTFSSTEKILIIEPYTLEILGEFRIDFVESRIFPTDPIFVHIISPTDFFVGKTFTTQLVQKDYQEIIGESGIGRPVSGHAEGIDTISNPHGGHSEGIGTRALYAGQHAGGTYNKGVSTETIHETGIGSAHTERKNGFEVYLDGILRAPEANDLSKMFNDLKAIVTAEYVKEKVALENWFTDFTVTSSSSTIFRSNIPSTDKHANISAVFQGGVMLRPIKYNQIDDGGFKAIQIKPEVSLNQGDWISLQNSKVYFKDY